MDIPDGGQAEMQGSGIKPYILKNVGGVYSCSCPAWRNQSLAIDQRTCKHLRKYRGDAAETERLGKALTSPIAKAREGVEKPPLMLAQSWTKGVDPTGWWMSEKLDGVRALWKGGKFITRLGNVYMAPGWFIQGLPKTTLDGELWIGRKQFNQTVSVVRRADAGDEWQEVKFMVFDAPEAGGVFEERINAIAPAVAKCEFAHCLPQTKIRNLKHLSDELDKVERLGGEGLMLRRPNSRYEVGRSTSLLKVKNFIDDEATLIGFQPGKGKNKGKVGAFIAKLENDIVFEIGTGLTDDDRANPPAIGSRLKFRYQELQESGQPRFASYIGLREFE